MILNVKFPHIMGHSSPDDAILAGKAMHAEFKWFEPGLAERTTIEATSYSPDWFALQLSNGRRVLVKADGQIVNASLDEQPLPPTEPWHAQVAVRFPGFKGPAEIDWRPSETQAAMTGALIVFVTFHPHWLILVTPDDVCAWFHVVHEAETGKALLYWSFGPD